MGMKAATGALKFFLVIVFITVCAAIIFSERTGKSERRDRVEMLLTSEAAKEGSNPLVGTGKPLDRQDLTKQAWGRIAMVHGTVKLKHVRVSKVLRRKDGSIDILVNYKIPSKPKGQGGLGEAHFEFRYDEAAGNWSISNQSIKARIP